MANGENAERHYGREYWSRRLPGMVAWGKIGKWLTHRRERAASRRLERDVRRDPEKWNEKTNT